MDTTAINQIALDIAFGSIVTNKVCYSFRLGQCQNHDVNKINLLFFSYDLLTTLF